MSARLQKEGSGVMSPQKDEATKGMRRTPEGELHILGNVSVAVSFTSSILISSLDPPSNIYIYFKANIFKLGFILSKVIRPDVSHFLFTYSFFTYQLVGHVKTKHLLLLFTLLIPPLEC